MEVAIGSVITMIVTPFVLFKAYMQHKELKDLRKRLGIDK